jgi:hypothetical protein
MVHLKEAALILSFASDLVIRRSSECDRVELRVLCLAGLNEENCGLRCWTAGRNGVPGSGYCNVSYYCDVCDVHIAWVVYLQHKIICDFCVVFSRSTGTTGSY